MIDDDINQQLEYQAQQTFRADGPVSIDFFSLKNLSRVAKENNRLKILSFRV